MTESRVREIDSRLPSEQALDAMSLEDSVEALKLAMVQCDRVASLRANPLAPLLRGDEIMSLAEHCELIKSRQDALHRALKLFPAAYPAQSFCRLECSLKFPRLAGIRTAH